MTWPIALVGGGPLAQVVLRVAVPGRGELRAFGPGADELGGPVERCRDLRSAVEGARVIMFAGATTELGSTAEAVGEFTTPDQVAVVPARGVRAGFELPLTTIRKHTCLRRIGIIGGPLHVREIDAEHHVNAVIATRFPEVWEVADLLVDPDRVTVHRSSDVTGVQVAGVYSHIASLVAGMARGLDVGETARGILLAQSLSEARSLGVALGADDRTFASVAGLGELIPRPSGGSDRHLEVGARLGRGASVREAIEGIDAEVEGMSAAEEATVVARDLGIQVPVARAVVAVVDGTASPREAVDGLLRRPLPGDA